MTHLITAYVYVSRHLPSYPQVFPAVHDALGELLRLAGEGPADIPHHGRASTRNIDISYP